MRACVQVHTHTRPPAPRAHTAFHPPQLPVQRLDHSCEAPAGLVQVQVAGPQTLAHGLLVGDTEEASVSVEARGSEGAGGSAGLLQAPLTRPPAR